MKKNRRNKIILLFFSVLFCIGFVDCKKQTAVNDTTPLWYNQLDIPLVPYNYQSQNLPSFFNNQFVRVADNTPTNNQISNWGATLGRVLFYDTRLSKNNSISCGSCHIQKYGFSDTAKFSRGFNKEKTKRHSMALVNARYYVSGKFFWDERATSLEKQVLEPIEDHVEMGMTLDSVLLRLKKIEYYPQLFEYAFGSQEIDTIKIAKALAQFVRSIVSYQSKYDIGRARVKKTTDNFPNFSKSENAGKKIFFKPNGLSCSSCHMTDLFFGDLARNNGLSLTDDRGVGGNTYRPIDMYRFKSPSLKNISIRAPYMHDGRFLTLDDVIEHYSSGIADHNYVDSHFKTPSGVFQFNLSLQEKIELISFLKTLTDEKLLTDPKFSNPFIGVRVN